MGNNGVEMHDETIGRPKEQLTKRIERGSTTCSCPSSPDALEFTCSVLEDDVGLLQVCNQRRERGLRTNKTLQKITIQQILLPSAGNESIQLSSS